MDYADDKYNKLYLEISNSDNLRSGEISAFATKLIRHSWFYKCIFCFVSIFLLKYIWLKLSNFLELSTHFTELRQFTPPLTRLLTFSFKVTST